MPPNFLVLYDHCLGQDVGRGGGRVLHDLSVSLHTLWSRSLLFSSQHALSPWLSGAVTISPFHTHIC